MQPNPGRKQASCSDMQPNPGRKQASCSDMQPNPGRKQASCSDMQPKERKMKRIIAVLVIIIILGGVIFTFSSYLVSTNDFGYYQIKQAAVTGKISVHDKPGMYGKFFGSITTYQISDMNYFSKSDLEGGSGESADTIRVRFNDGGTADISGSIKFRLSQKEENQLLLHEDYKSYDKVQSDLIRQVITEALMQTAALMKAEESYSTRKSEFTAMAEEQIRRGIFKTMAEQRIYTNLEGKEFIERTVKVKYDDSGIAVINKTSPFIRYDIEILQFVVKDIDFDATIDSLIAKKKEAEQERIVAQANAERAKQDAITAEEQGKALIAVAKAEEEVIKIKAVTQAEKEYAVSQLNRQKAEEEAAGELIKREAEARGAALLVQAGLTPRDKAIIDKETAIGVAAEMAKIQLPEVMIFGSGEGSPTNPFDAIGLEAFMNITDKISKSKEN
jgi:regulator of protease activity HflC (stomatin/prohibitin superfamily)